MNYEEEIEDLEERLSLYLCNIDSNNARYGNLTQKIKRMEEQLELFKKAQAFDEIVRCMDYRQAHDETDVMTIQDIDYVIWKYFKSREGDEDE